MVEGIVLGILTWISYIFTYHNLPNFLKKLLMKSNFVTDIICTVFTFLTLSAISHSIISVVGSIVCGLLVELTLIIAKMKKS